MESPVIRLATPSDAELVDSMVREIARHEGSLSSVASDSDAWTRMLARQDVLVLIATVSGRPVGYASTIKRLQPWLGTDVVALDDLWIRPAARDRGTGRALMAAVARLAARESLTVVWGVCSDNTAAHRFYEGLGAHLNAKVVARWAPEHYAWAID